MRWSRERRDPDETIDLVVFEGVEAYSFRHDCLGNIISDIREQAARRGTASAPPMAWGFAEGRVVTTATGFKSS